MSPLSHNYSSCDECGDGPSLLSRPEPTWQGLGCSIIWRALCSVEKRMPVDFTGLLIAIVLWGGGTIGTFLSIRAAQRKRPDDGSGILTPLGTAIAWTICASVALAMVGIFIIWFYDWIHGRA